MTDAMNRRQAITATAAAPLVMIDTPQAAQDTDPAVVAYRITVDAEAASNAAYAAADMPNFVYIDGKAAFTAGGIDRLIEIYAGKRAMAHAFANANWQEGDRTPEQVERDEQAREATAEPAPDAATLKAELADRQRRKAEAVKTHRVEETREAFFEARRVLIDTPATTIAGIAAKLRFAVGPAEEVEPGDAESELIFGAIADAERLASEGAA